MRSLRAELPRAVLTAACLCGAAAGLHAQGAVEADSAPAAASAASVASASDGSHEARSARIEAAADKLRTDPLLSGTHKEHTLRWKDDGKRDKKRPDDGSAMAWLAAFARFLNDTSRFLFWGLVAILVAVALVSARHLVQLRTFRLRAAAESAVSHVRDLDVRPESLPDDVGSAAWALWQAGKVPAALSLLYRGALSRMIHRFEVPITASATEGECLDMARGRLAPEAMRYVTQVVRAWEANTYGGRALSMAMGESLCTGFGRRLDALPAAAGGEA
jgi:hypothetical protein